MFKATMNHGFHMTFANGYTISCQWGASNCCARYGEHLQGRYDYYKDLHQEIVSCEDCEVLIWHEAQPRKHLSSRIAREAGVDVGYDDDEGGLLYRVTTDDVAKLVAYLSALPGQQ